MVVPYYLFFGGFKILLEMSSWLVWTTEYLDRHLTEFSPYLFFLGGIKVTTNGTILRLLFRLFN